MKLEAFNQLTHHQQFELLYQCCSSENWAKKLADQTPFASLPELKQMADVLFQQLAEADLLQAFAGHPKIGDVNSLKAKYAQTKALASGEQSGVQQADDETLVALAQANTDYQQRYGFIFIVCATGKSAQQMLDILNSRMDNSYQQELQQAGEQQRQIMQIRLNKLIEGEQHL